MARDYIPSNEVDLLPFLQAISSFLTINFASVGLATGDASAFDTTTDSFSTAYAANITAQNLSKSARQTKDVAKRNAIAECRALVKRIQAHPNFSDAQRATLSLTIPDLIPTPVAAPLSTPMISIDFSQRGQHLVNFSDASTPNSKAKPPNIHGLALYRKVAATQPSGIGTMEYIGTFTSQGRALVYEESQYGLQVYYCGFWETAKGLRGAISDFTNATISK